MRTVLLGVVLAVAMTLSASAKAPSTTWVKYAGVQGWQQHWQECDTTEEGAADGFVRCQDTVPTKKYNTQVGVYFAPQSPVSILD